LRKAEDELARLNSVRWIPKPCADPPAGFIEEFISDRRKLTRAAETYLARFCDPVLTVRPKMVRRNLPQFGEMLP
jgi:hypothetical protein